MIDEKKLIEDLSRWTQDDLYSPKYFEILVEAQPRIKEEKNNKTIINLIKKVSKSHS